MSLTIDPSMFPSEAVLKSLEGEQVVRVSRKSIVDALKTQTTTISALFQDAVQKAELIQSLEENNRNLTKLVYDLSDKLDVVSNQVEEQGAMVLEHEEILGSGKIEKLFLRVDALEAQTAATEKRVEEGFQGAAAERERIETDTLNNLREVRKSIKDLREEAEGLDVRASSLEERLKDLGHINRDGIFRIKGERVAVGANEVPVDEMFAGVRKDFSNVTGEFRTTIAEHSDILEGYGPKLKLLPDLIQTATENKKMFSDLGLGSDKPGEKGILQQFADMKEDMIDVQKGLLEKCDIKKMLETVELKYDEIVDHLQEAIQAAVEDEDQFKRVTEELKEMCKNLMMNKADKIALIEFNERLNATKVLAEQVQDIQHDIVDKVGKDDLNEMLLVKEQRDKEEYSNMISGMAHKLERNITRKVQQFAADNMDSNSFGGGFSISGGGGGRRSGGRRPSAGGMGSAVGSKKFKNSPNRSQSYGGAKAPHNSGPSARGGSAPDGGYVGGPGGGRGGGPGGGPGGGSGGRNSSGGGYNNGGGQGQHGGHNGYGSEAGGGQGQHGGYGGGGGSGGGYGDNGDDGYASYGGGGGGGGHSQGGGSGRGGYGGPGARSRPGSDNYDGPSPETISRPRLGPGGPSLGGGFQVMVPIKDGSSGKQRTKLPRVNSQPQNTYADEGRAY